MMTGKENPNSEHRNPMLHCEVALLRSTRTNSNEQNKSRILTKKGTDAKRDPVPDFPVVQNFYISMQ